MPRHTAFPNGVLSYRRDTNSAVKSATTYTVEAVAGDILGRTLIFDNPAARTVTLPLIAGTADGAIVTIVNDIDGVLLTVDPNASDGINFGDQVVDGVTIVNTAATAKKGDYVTLATVGSASTYWSVVAIGGIWAVGA